MCRFMLKVNNKDIRKGLSVQGLCFSVFIIELELIVDVIKSIFHILASSFRIIFKSVLFNSMLQFFQLLVCYLFSVCQQIWTVGINKGLSPEAANGGVL